MSVALRVRNLRVQYGSILAVDDVSFDVRMGELVALLGPNGSGKSSTLAVAAGQLDPRSGEARAMGKTRGEDRLGYSRAIGYLPQKPALYDELTVRNNLLFIGKLYGLRGRTLTDRIDAVLSRYRLTDRIRDRVGTLSGGLAQRVNLAASLLHDPRIVLLDEPTAALDPASRESFMADLQELRSEGRAILMTTHHLDEAETGCDRVVVLSRGRIVAQGSPEELAAASGRAVLYAHLSHRMPPESESAWRSLLGDEIDVELTGRRLRLAADTQDELGRALATLLSAGVSLHAFRTPPSPWEGLLRGRGLSRPASDRQAATSCSR